jgi:DNA polymerase I
MKWLVLDMGYLCHRAAHSTGALRYQGQATGVVFGVAQALVGMMEQFDTRALVFCFDWGPYHRAKVCPTYKQSRQAKSPEAAEAQEIIRAQIRDLRDGGLAQCGFRNILAAQGFEADDWAAYVARGLANDGDQVVVVSNDQDLYQVLGPQVAIYRPGKPLYTEALFVAEYGIRPALWADVKAIAGCSGDNVPGVRGVGEKTAAKFMAGALSPDSAAYKKIIQGSQVWQDNLEVVRLPWPYPHLVQPLERHPLPVPVWQRFVDTYGLVSLGSAHKARHPRPRLID